MQTIRESLWQPLDSGCNVPVHNTKLPQLSSIGSTTASNETASLNSSSLQRAAFSAEQQDQWCDSWNKTTERLLTRQEVLWSSGAGQLHIGTQGEYFWESHISTNLSNPYSWKRLSSFKKGLLHILMSAMTVSNVFLFPFTKEFWEFCLFFSLLCSQHYEITLTPARSSLLSPSLFVFELRGEKDNQEVSQKDQIEPNVPSVLISVV